MGTFKNIAILILILTSMALFLTVGKTDANTVYFLCSTLVAFIKVLGFLIIPLSKFVAIDRSYIYLCLYIGGCGVFRIINLVLRAMGIGAQGEQTFLFVFLISIMEIIAIYNVIESEESDLDNKTVVTNVVGFISIFIFISAIVTSLTYLNSIFNLQIFSNLIELMELIFLFRFTIQAIMLSLYISIIIVINFYSNNIYNLPIKKDIIKFIVVRMIHSSVYLILNRTLICFYVNLILLILTGYYIGKIYFTCLLKNPNETFFLTLKLKNRDLENAYKELEEYSEIIRDENNHVNNIINSFPEAVCILKKGKILSVNTRFKEIFKCYDDNMFIGKYTLEIVREDYHLKYLSKLQELHTKGRCDEIEYVLEFNGVEFIGEVTLSKIKRGNSDIVVSVIRDVTKKRLIAKLNDELAYKERENKVRSELLTNISHEFKTPVHVIYSAIQMQNLYSKKNDINNILKFNDVIKQNCFRLIRLINNFIDITRFEADMEIKANIKPLNIVPLVENTVETVISYCNNNEISIIFDTENEEIYGEFDSEMMDRIMLNLLSNAIKYNVDNGDIIVNINETEHEMIISVKDTGVGISKDDLDRLFNRFERLDKSLSRKREGTGIGLNIVKSLVEYQNGRIEVSSELGKGTTFSLRFPKIDGNLENISHCEISKEELINKVSLELSDII